MSILCIYIRPNAVVPCKIPDATAFNFNSNTVVAGVELWRIRYYYVSNHNLMKSIAKALVIGTQRQNNLTLISGFLLSMPSTNSNLRTPMYAALSAELHSKYTTTNYCCSAAATVCPGLKIALLFLLNPENSAMHAIMPTSVCSTGAATCKF